MAKVKTLADGEEYILSKSKFCSGLQCHRYLYMLVHAPDQVPPPDDATRFKFAQGNEVGALARDTFPGGELIKMMPWSTVVRRTRDALDKNDVIYEAAFVHDSVVVMVDVLKRREDGRYDMVEVKASNSLKDEHIPDLSIQRYVLEGAGLDVATTYLMHMNRDYTIDSGLEPLMMEDCTSAVEDFLPQVGEHLDAQKAMLDCDSGPESTIGPHCDRPYECLLKEECWASLPADSIFNIPGFRNRWKLYNEGIIALDDLPGDTKLNAAQKAFLESHKTGKPIYDPAAIRSALGELVEPLHFLDFETIGYALPKHEGMRPWGQLPFQWSLHIRDGGDLRHEEFLWESADDPRPAFIEALLEAVEPRGSIIVYSSFEKSRLNEIARQFPMYAAAIDKLVSRLWDQLEIFRKHYTDARFGGSNSIKKVLEVLVPELSYKGLRVRDGDTAMAIYAKLLEADDERKRKRYRKALLEYCERDTVAMVKIHDRLVELVE